MDNIFGRRRERYELVTAGHEFILTALPFRPGASRAALAGFSLLASRSSLPVPELDAVLLNLLAVLDPHSHGRLPSLVDRYLAARRTLPDAVARFHACVEDVIRYRGVGNSDVQQAIAIIEERYMDSSLTQSAVADELRLGPRELSTSFTTQTGVTFSEYLRNVRLDRAATLLMSSGDRIKDTWVRVGYNDASNFVHQFKERFGTTPSDYRARAIHSAIRPSDSSVSEGWPAGAPHTGDASGTVLIVDDNECTRETLGTHLRVAGHRVALAADGEAGLREGQRCILGAVVLDHHLPDMDGLDWLRAFRRQQHSPSPGVLLFTADWDVADRAKEIAALGALLVSKLCDLDEVRRLVDSLKAMRATFGGVASDRAS